MLTGAPDNQKSSVKKIEVFHLKLLIHLMHLVSSAQCIYLHIFHKIKTFLYKKCKKKTKPFTKGLTEKSTTLQYTENLISLVVQFFTYKYEITSKVNFILYIIRESLQFVIVSRLGWTPFQKFVLSVLEFDKKKIYKKKKK